jgi:hypothetical protein
MMKIIGSARGVIGDRAADWLGKGARLTFARARVEKCTRELAALEQGLADKLAAEERARDLAALAVLEARFGRAHFRLTIAPDVAELVAARQHVEAVIARIRSVGEEQVEGRARAIALAEKHGAAAPVEAVDADTGERIALVETHLAMLAAYPADARDTAPNLSEWLSLPPTLDALAPWVVRFLVGGEYGPPRVLVTPAEIIEAVLAEGRDTTQRIERERGTAASIAGTAARTDGMKDPIFRASPPMPRRSSPSGRGSSKAPPHSGSPSLRTSTTPHRSRPSAPGSVAARATD